MATVTKNKARKLPSPQFDGVPYGNATKLHYTFATNASGVMVDSDLVTAVQIADKVVLGVIPAGTKLIDALAIVSDAFTALATADIGFEYVDGVDSAAVPQDADYFHTAAALSAQGRLPADNAAVAPVVLPKDAFVILTLAGAALDAAGQVDIFIEGVLEGRA